MIGISKFCTGSLEFGKLHECRLDLERPFPTVITMPPEKHRRDLKVLPEKHRRDPKLFCNYLACPKGTQVRLTNPAWTNLNYLGEREACRIKRELHLPEH